MEISNEKEKRSYAFLMSYLVGLYYVVIYKWADKKDVLYSYLKQRKFWEDAEKVVKGEKKEFTMELEQKALSIVMHRREGEGFSIEMTFADGHSADRFMQILQQANEIGDFGLSEKFSINSPESLWPRMINMSKVRQCGTIITICLPEEKIFIEQAIKSSPKTKRGLIQ